MTFREQRQRTRELDDLRIARGLTRSEREEADKLHEKLYHRLLRAS